MEKFQSFLQFISYKYKLNNDSIMSYLEDFVKNEKSSLITNNLEEQYKNYIAIEQPTYRNYA